MLPVTLGPPLGVGRTDREPVDWHLDWGAPLPMFLGLDSLNSKWNAYMGWKASSYLASCFRVVPKGQISLQGMGWGWHQDQLGPYWQGAEVWGREEKWLEIEQVLQEEHRGGVGGGKPWRRSMLCSVASGVRPTGGEGVSKLGLGGYCSSLCGWCLSGWR